MRIVHLPSPATTKTAADMTAVFAFSVLQLENPAMVTAPRKLFVLQ